jgi:hypothetical protein
MGKKELVEALQSIAPLAFLQVGTLVSPKPATRECLRAALASAGLLHQDSGVAFAGEQVLGQSHISGKEGQQGLPHTFASLPMLPRVSDGDFSTGQAGRALQQVF